MNSESEQFCFSKSPAHDKDLPCGRRTSSRRFSSFRRPFLRLGGAKLPALHGSPCKHKLLCRHVRGCCSKSLLCSSKYLPRMEHTALSLTVSACADAEIIQTVHGWRHRSVSMMFAIRPPLQQEKRNSRNHLPSFRFPMARLPGSTGSMSCSFGQT